MKRRFLYITIVLLLLGALGAWYGDRMLRSKQHPGLRVFLRQWWVNYPRSFDLEPELVRIRVDEEALEGMTGVVERARERGVIIPEDNLFVKAEMEHGGRTFKAKMRIKGKLTDHVEGRKWSFRVIARKDGGVHGMRRFSLQHPGTRNYLTDWFYHRIMAGEGHVALRYMFLRVELNGEDLGIYALEEHFGPELLENNQRLKGPLVRFDPGLYWIHRLNEMAGVEYDEAFAGQHVSALDAYEGNNVMKDPAMRASFEQAVGLMDAYRRGQLTADKVFDLDRVAARHAILDLLGGWRSVDWSDVKFHFDPVLRRLEPVSYEASSGWPITRLIGAYRHRGMPQPGDELHDALFKDAELFRAYVRHLERVARKEYLDSLFTAIGPALDSASATLYREFPYKELDRKVYYRNQETIRRLLDVPKPFHAYLERMEPGAVVLKVLPIESLPMEVEGVLLPDGSMLPIQGAAIVSSRPERGVGDPMLLRFSGNWPDSIPVSNARVACRVLGSQRAREVDVFPHRMPGAGEVAGYPDQLAPNDHSFPFCVRDDADRTIHFKPGRWVLDRDLVLPEGYTVHAVAPLHVEMKDGARIISRSVLRWKGHEEAPIRVEGGAGSQVLLLGAPGQSRLEHVHIMGLGGPGAEERVPAVHVHRSDLVMRQCTLAVAGGGVGLRAAMGRVEVLGSLFNGGHDQLVVDHVELVLRNTGFADASDDAITLRGGTADLVGMQADRIKGIALKAALRATVEMKDMDVGTVGKGVEASEGAQVKLSGGRVSGAGVGLEADKDLLRYGATLIEATGLKLRDNGQDHKSAEGGVIRMDGKVMGNPASAE